MKNFKYNTKIISILTSSVLVLTFSGCTSNKTDDKAIYDNIDYEEHTTYDESASSASKSVTKNIDTTIGLTTDVITEKAVETTIPAYTEPITSSILETYTEVVNDLTPEESMILEHFKKLGDDIKNYVDSEELLEKSKAYFIYCVDFLFFDEPINGVTFSSLRDSVKQQILENIADIDALICTKYPNYKETINEKYSYVYDHANDIIKRGSENIKDFSKEKIGEENIEKYDEIKELFKEQVADNYDDLSEYAEKGKEKVKSWYEEFKRN